MRPNHPQHLALYYAIGEGIINIGRHQVKLFGLRTSMKPGQVVSQSTAQGHNQTMLLDSVDQHSQMNSFTSLTLLLAVSSINHASSQPIKCTFHFLPLKWSAELQRWTLPTHRMHTAWQLPQGAPSSSIRRWSVKKTQLRDICLLDLARSSNNSNLRSLRCHRWGKNRLLPPSDLWI